MTYTVAIGVLLSLGDIQDFTEEEVLNAVEKILSMETINATPKQALLNALRWFWDKTVEEVDHEPPEG